MFLIIGDKTISRETLVAWLDAQGVDDVHGVVNQIERKGRCMIDNQRVLYVK